MGGRTFTIGLDRDITERMRAEAELRASEEKMRLIFENAFDGSASTKSGLTRTSAP